MIMNGWSNLSFWGSSTHKKIRLNLADAVRDKVTVLPYASMMFRALTTTPFNEVKCVILGQDPYHRSGLACGMAFSVLPFTKTLPPTLKNILKEYHDDLGFPVPKHGCLYPWATKGVLLLNTSLTVEKGKPNSHRKWGWYKLTSEIIRKLSSQKERPISFCLWGKQAQDYRGLINDERHLLIESSHPSPYSVNQGFFGHKPFSRTNSFLGEAEAIDWRI